MTGRQLFEKYASLRDHSGNEKDQYAQTLQTSLALFGDKVYTMLEQAEREGRKIELIEDLEVEGDPTGMKLV
ncbi:MAG: hypothetical protein J7577_00795 [Sphingobacteriaceae bacterium]|nr:hypothetical protein [Sphingobacteriaceae bacterium]